MEKADRKKLHENHVGAGGRRRGRVCVCVWGGGGRQAIPDK